MRRNIKKKWFQNITVKTKHTVYLLEEEVKLLDKKSKKYHLTKAAWLRKMIVEEKNPDPIFLADEKLARQLINELNKITNNIGQIYYNSVDKKDGIDPDVEKIKINYFELCTEIAKVTKTEKNEIKPWVKRTVEKRTNSWDDYYGWLEE